MGSQELSRGRGTNPTVVVRDDLRVPTILLRLALVEADVAQLKGRLTGIEARLRQLETPEQGPPS